MSAARVAGLAAAVAFAAGCLSKPSHFECDFAAAASTDLSARLGTEQGGGNSVTPCPDGVVVGMEITLTRTPGGFQEKTAVAATLHCATLSTRDGDYATGMVTKQNVAGGFATSDGPYAADCPDGQVVIGLAAHRVATDKDHLFNSFVLLCSAVDQSGAPTGGVTRVRIVETGVTPSDTEARCSAGKVLQGLKSYTGSELDRVDLLCTQMPCAAP